MHQRFMHVHMLSDDPVAAPTGREGVRHDPPGPAARTPRLRGIPTGPPRRRRRQRDVLALDRAREGGLPESLGGARSTRRTAPHIDHVALSGPSGQTVARLKRDVAVSAGRRELWGRSGPFVSAGQRGTRDRRRPPEPTVRPARVSRYWPGATSSNIKAKARRSV
jgi:hypothetical protein